LDWGIGDKNGEIESITKIVNEIKIEILTLDNEKRSFRK
jgi:hypothetical protein